MTQRYEPKDITIKLVDVTAAVVEAYGGKENAEYIAGKPLPDVDLRLVAEADNGLRVTFHAGAKLSAEDILAFVNGDS